MILDELHERTNGGSVWIGLERKVESKRFCDIVHTKKDMYVYLFVRVLPLVRGDVISSTIIQLILGSGMTRHLWITFSGRRTSPTGRAVSACACTSTTSREAGTTMTVTMNRRLCAKPEKVRPQLSFISGLLCPIATRYVSRQRHRAHHCTPLVTDIDMVV